VAWRISGVAEGRTWRKELDVAFYRRAWGVGGGLQRVGWRILLQCVGVRYGKRNGGRVGRKSHVARSPPLHVSELVYLGGGA
jgi:hypothetical protein